MAVNWTTLINKLWLGMDCILLVGDLTFKIETAAICGVCTWVTIHVNDLLI